LSVSNGEELRRGLLRGVIYFLIAISVSLITANVLFSEVRGAYIAYRVPPSYIIVLLSAFFTVVALVIVTFASYSISKVTALMLSFFALAASFYSYEHYIVCSRGLTVSVLPFILVLSDSSHSVYVIDVGQISLVIGFALLYFILRSRRKEQRDVF